MARISVKKLADVVYAQLQQHSSEKVAKNIAQYLVSEKRTADLPKVMREVANIRFQKEGIQEVHMTSAFQIDKNLQKQILAEMDIEKCVVNEVIDKDVIGGVRIESNDTVFDLSVRSRLQKLKASWR